MVTKKKSLCCTFLISCLLFRNIIFIFFNNHNYLLTDHEFNHFDNPNSRIVLLGGDHKLKKRTFIYPGIIHNILVIFFFKESIQKTEIVEYSKSISNPQFMNPIIQVYKLIYAYWLLEIGLIDTAKKYINFSLMIFIDFSFLDIMILFYQLYPKIKILIHIIDYF